MQIRVGITEGSDLHRAHDINLRRSNLFEAPTKRGLMATSLRRTPDSCRDIATGVPKVCTHVRKSAAVILIQHRNSRRGRQSNSRTRYRAMPLSTSSAIFGSQSKYCDSLSSATRYESRRIRGH